MIRKLSHLGLILWLCTAVALARPEPGGARGGETQSPSSTKLLRLAQWTDVHSMGPHYNGPAFEKAVHDSLAGHPDAIVLTGDFCDNSGELDTFPARFHQAVSLLQEKLQDFPGAVFFALGNDDLLRNYQTDPELLRAAYQDCKSVFGERYYLDELGNGASPNRLGGMLWLTLNSQIFTDKNNYFKAPAQANQTLDFLKKHCQQEAAQETPLVLVMHIPPTGDLYLKASPWKSEYQQRLQEILDSYPGQVILLCGHFHRNHVQAISHPRVPAVVLTAGALAKKYDYSSSWRQYKWTLGDTGNVEAIDYTIHYPLHPNWDSFYRVVPREVQNFFDALMNDRALYVRYFCDIYGHHPEYRQWAEDPAKRETLLEQFWLKPQSSP